MFHRHPPSFVVSAALLFFPQLSPADTIIPDAQQVLQITAPKAALSQPLIADNQCFIANWAVTDDKGKLKDTYQNYFTVKVPAIDLVFPFTQSNSGPFNSENSTDFSNPATYRAAVSVNRGPWMQLTWGGQKSKECPYRGLILNDPLPLSVKQGDTLILRTEITVPPKGKWALGAQARTGGSDPNWMEGGTDSDVNSLLSDHADFRPAAGQFTHTAQGVFGKPVGNPSFHSALIVGDSISPYVQTAVSAIGNAVPLCYFGQAGESGIRFWNQGRVRQELFGGIGVLLYQDGVNDLRTMQPFERLKAAATNTWAAFHAAGGKHLIIFTATPLSKSTNKWETEAGQTPDFEPEVRTRWNDFVRSLSSQDVGMKLTIIDTAFLFESAKNNSLWKPGANGKSLTDDGCHPNGAGYALIENKLGLKIREAVQQD